MDVDLLRPGTVPISPDTILWFEFLLDPTLLKKHLSKPSPDPSGCELIMEFLSVDTKPNSKPTSERIVDLEAPPSPQSLISGASVQYTRKQLALKILALKVAAWYRWNLDIFEAKLPPQIQQQLIQDLVYVATDGAFSIPPQEIPEELLQRQEVQFALTLYHQWVLRFPVKAAFFTKSPKMSFVHLPGMPPDTGYNAMNPNFEKILRSCEAARALAIRHLEDMLALYEPTASAGRRASRKVPVPAPDTFAHLGEDRAARHAWAAAPRVSQHELAMQVHFDLCANYFFYAQHDLAKKHILGCRENCNLLEREVAAYGYGAHGAQAMPWGEFSFASVAKEDILGYIRALNLGLEVLNEEPSLLQKLQESISNNYSGLVSVLQADNLAREIPFVHRQTVELDLACAAGAAGAARGAGRGARDLQERVPALNAVRYVLEGGLPSTQPEFLNKFKTVGIKFFDLLIWAMAPVLASDLSDADWENLRMFFLHLATAECKIPLERIDDYMRKHLGARGEAVRRRLVSDDELRLARADLAAQDDEAAELPPELLADDWDAPGLDCKAVKELEVGRLRKRLAAADSADEVRVCLVKLATLAPATQLWKLSPSWRPAGALAGALMSLPRGFLQDFGYVVSGLARARAEAGAARAALALLAALEAEVRGQAAGGGDAALAKLSRLLGWELLLLQVNVVVSEWPHHRLNLPALAAKAKACIAAANTNDTVLPRAQVLEACWVCLVNACEWEGAAGAGAGAGAEPRAALCLACLELQRTAASRKFSRQLWDYALSVFNTSSSGPSKRSAGGAQARDAGADLRHGFTSLLAGLREPLAVTVMLSLLARIHNVLVDDSSVDLVVDYVALWPANISNANNYNVKLVLECIAELLDRSLKLYPYNTSWLRLLGDVHAARGAGGAGAALGAYAAALAAGSRHFAARAPHEGGIARRAARAAAPACPALAAALSQLPREPDLALAFKCLAEKSNTAADAMDAYYACLWDGTLLETATASHARRGEAGRRARAVRAQGELELNANNSEDILREAAAVRRARLLRALTDQYLA